jgi:hypothetical protein
LAKRVNDLSIIYTGSILIVKKWILVKIPSAQAHRAAQCVVDIDEPSRWGGGGGFD